MARPSEYDLDLCKEICDEVANGFNIKAVLSSKSSYPDFSTWCRWKRNNPELYNLYVNAIQDKAESVDEEIDLIMAEARGGGMEPAMANVLIQTLKWKAAKYYPKMFGDKVQTEHSGEIKGLASINLSKLSDAALAELEASADGSD